MYVPTLDHATVTVMDATDTRRPTFVLRNVQAILTDADGVTVAGPFITVAGFDANGEPTSGRTMERAADLETDFSVTGRMRFGHGEWIVGIVPSE